MFIKEVVFLSYQTKFLLPHPRFRTGGPLLGVFLDDDLGIILGFDIDSKRHLHYSIY